MRTAAYNADVASGRRRRKNVPRHILYILTGMEYSMVKNKKVQQLTPEELRIWDMLKKKNIPIINVDERWLRLFPDNEKTPAIKRLEKELKAPEQVPLIMLLDNLQDPGNLGTKHEGG